MIEFIYLHPFISLFAFMVLCEAVVDTITALRKK